MPELLVDDVAEPQEEPSELGTWDAMLDDDPDNYDLTVPSFILLNSRLAVDVRENQWNLQFR